MKKILIILITIPLIFNSCKKEDDSPNSGNNNTSGSILGTWKVENYTITDIQGYIDPVLLTETILKTETLTMNTYPVNVFHIYRDNGTFSEYNYENDTISGYQHYDYVKNGDEISLTFEGNDVRTQTVTSLTSNNLNISFEYYDPYDDGNDTTMFYRSTGDLQFIKSQLPDFTTELLNKKKSVSGYNSFLNRRENR